MTRGEFIVSFMEEDWSVFGNTWWSYLRSYYIHSNVDLSWRI